MKIFRIFIMTLCCCAGCLYSPAQNAADSILYHLKLIYGAKTSDSVHLSETIKLLYRNQKEVLLENKDIHNEMQRLKTVLDERQYYDLQADLFRSHLDFDSVPNAILIKYGRAYIAENKNDYSSNYGRANLLMLMRELRIPYRNSRQIYEGIEYFNSLATDFLSKNDSDAVTICYNVLCGFYNRLGINEKAEYYMLKSIDYLNENQVTQDSPIIEFVLGISGKANRYSVLGSYKIEEGKPEQAEEYLRTAIRYYWKLATPELFADGPYIFLQMARCKSIAESDSSYYYFNETLHNFGLYSPNSWSYSFFYLQRGGDFLRKNLLDSAAYFIRKSKQLKDSLQLTIVTAWGALVPNYYYALLQMKQHNPGESIKLLLVEIMELRKMNVRIQMMMELKLLAEAYSAAGRQKESLAALWELLALKETREKESADAKSVSFDIEKKMQQNDISIATLKARDESNRKTRYYLYGITALLGLFAVTLGFAIFNKQKSNTSLTEKNQEISATLEKLKQTQSQLIQSEKMASLGELTAGVAHEIQNPLNFVNNFSEVNKELIAELKTEIKKGNFEEVNAIADNIEANEEKINHHGKRADGIVKGMLQHSRSSSGVKEPVDINKLADEYLRLAYHGLRAKDKSFNVTSKTDYDESVGNITVIPQDIGRVILNLVNNAFYAVAEKKKQSPDWYEPTVSVSTKKVNGKVEIKVNDNGNGIPQKVLDKIFQPFFTTKPTGQGTGLGLSLAYDIVKAHGGELKVETKEARPDDPVGRGEGTEFIVQLPVA